MDLAAEIRIWNALRDRLAQEHPEMVQDDLFDSLDGAGDLADHLRYLVRKRRHMLADAEALKGMIKELVHRLARIEVAAEKIGESVVWAMQEAGIAKLKAPDFSVSIGFGKAPLSGADSLDPSTLPPRFVRTKLEVDRVALRAALEGGENLEGLAVYLGNAKPHIIVRKA
jgi:hypothetical protein